MCLILQNVCKKYFRDLLEQGNRSQFGGYVNWFIYNGRMLSMLTAFELDVMRIHWLILIFVMVLGGSTAAQKIEYSSRIDIPLTGRSEKFVRNEVFADWLSNTDIVAFTRDWRLSRVNVNTKEIKWTRKWLHRVSGYAVCSSCQRVGLICDKSSDDINELLNPSVVLINAKDGSTFVNKDINQLAKITGGEFSNPSQIAINPKNCNVLISRFSTHFGNNAFIFSPNLDELQTKVGVDAMPSEIAFTHNGERLTVLADFDVLNIREVKNNKDIYFEGKRIEQPRNTFTSVVDAPFFSSAFHDGKNLVVYSRDNSWFMGRVFVNRLDNKSKIEFDGLHGHIVMDVDFEKSHIAITGTSKDIFLFDFDGKKLAELKNPTGRRNFGLRFSPNGERLLVCNWNAIWVFNIKAK